jgi:hypothetical protein
VRTVNRAEDIVLGRPFHVVAYEKIEQAVAIVIEPERGGAEGTAAAEPGFFRHVYEVAFTGVLK